MAKRIRVAWNNPANVANLDHIEIWRKTGVAGIFEKIGTNITTITASTALFYLDENSGAGLADGQQYFYDVRTYNSAGGFTSVQSNATISGIIIAPPTALTAGTPTFDTIPLTWTKSTTGVMTEYRVYRNNVLLRTFVGDVASGTITGLSSSTAYSLTVRAFNGSSESVDSNVITATTASDTTAPTVIWAYVPHDNPATLIVKFNEPVNCANPNFVNRSTQTATAVSGSGTDILTFTFATAVPIELRGIQIAFANGHVVQDLAGNLFAPGGPISAPNMFLGVGAEIGVAGAHSRNGETNSIAMFTNSNVTATVETVDVFRGIYAARLTTIASGTSTTRGSLALNVLNTKKYKHVVWAKKVGGETATLSQLDGSLAPTVQNVPADGVFRPYSYLSETPSTNASANLRFNLGSGTVTAGSYLLLDNFATVEYL